MKLDVFPFVTRDLVTQASPDLVVAEASTIGFAPGYFPRMIPTDLGNERSFLKVRTNPDVAIYKQQAGTLMLHVLND